MYKNAELKDDNHSKVTANIDKTRLLSEKASC